VDWVIGESDLEAFNRQAMPLVVDIRRPAEFATDHLASSINIPLQDLDGRRATLAPHKVVVIDGRDIGDKEVVAASRIIRLAGTQYVVVVRRLRNTQLTD
jgi:rhodanese-related sulfurtransferase